MEIFALVCRVEHSWIFQHALLCLVLFEWSAPCGHLGQRGQSCMLCRYTDVFFCSDFLICLISEFSGSLSGVITLMFVLSLKCLWLFLTLCELWHKIPWNDKLILSGGFLLRCTTYLRFARRSGLAGAGIGCSDSQETLCRCSLATAASVSPSSCARLDCRWGFCKSFLLW